jgi:hypothetical protein
MNFEEETPHIIDDRQILHALPAFRLGFLCESVWGGGGVGVCYLFTFDRMEDAWMERVFISLFFFVCRGASSPQ